MIFYVRFCDALNKNFLGTNSITTKMSQSQPVIPVTMQYGGSEGYGGGQFHHLEHAINRSADHIKNDVNRSAEHTQADVQRSGYQLNEAVRGSAEHTQADVQRGAYQTQGAVQHSTDHVRADVQRGDYQTQGAIQHATDHVRGDINRTADHTQDDVKNGTAFIRSDVSDVLAAVNSHASFNQGLSHASSIEARQAVERNADKASLDSNRNADYINSNISSTSTAGLLATQAASVQGLLATQQSSVATALGIQNTSSDLKTQILDTRRDISGILQSNFAALGVQSEKNAAEVVQQVLTQAQSVLLGQKDAEVNASNNRAALALQASENKYNLSLQASENSKDIQLQNANYKAYLENHITKTAADGILKTSETGCKIMEKLAECCCENKIAIAATQQLIISTSNAAQTAQLQSALQSAQNDALLAKIAAIPK